MANGADSSGHPNNSTVSGAAQPEQQPPSFEATLADLEKVVKELESGELTLERSLELFERGTALSAVCRKQLEEAERRVEILLKKAGKVQAEPFRPGKA